MNLSMKQKQNEGHREQTGDCQGGWEWERDALGVRDQQKQRLEGIHQNDGTG